MDLSVGHKPDDWVFMLLCETCFLNFDMVLAYYLSEVNNKKDKLTIFADCKLSNIQTTKIPYYISYFMDTDSWKGWLSTGHVTSMHSYSMWPKYRKANCNVSIERADTRKRTWGPTSKLTRAAFHSQPAAPQPHTLLVIQLESRRHTKISWIFIFCHWAISLTVEYILTLLFFNTWLPWRQLIYFKKDLWNEHIQNTLVFIWWWVISIKTEIPFLYSHRSELLHTVLTVKGQVCLQGTLIQIRDPQLSTVSQVSNLGLRTVQRKKSKLLHQLFIGSTTNGHRGQWHSPTWAFL